MKNILKFMRIAVAMSLSLFVFPACDVISGGDEHAEVEGFSIAQNGTEVIRYFNGNIQNNGTLSVNKGETSTDFTIKWLDGKGAITTVEEGSSLHVKATNAAIADVVTSGAWTFKLKGIANGTSSLEIGLLHSGHFDFEKRPVPVAVK